jgi:hypothetical protein
MLGVQIMEELLPAGFTSWHKDEAEALAGAALAV